MRISTWEWEGIGKNLFLHTSTSEADIYRGKGQEGLTLLKTFLYL